MTSHASLVYATSGPTNTATYMNYKIFAYSDSTSVGESDPTSFLWIGYNDMLVRFLIFTLVLLFAFLKFLYVSYIYIDRA